MSPGRTPLANTNGKDRKNTTEGRKTIKVMNIQDIFNISAVIFTVGNLAAMGLELNVGEAINALRSERFVVLVFVWSWAVGPAFTYLLSKVLPVAEPYAIGFFGPAP